MSARRPPVPLLVLSAGAAGLVLLPLAVTVWQAAGMSAREAAGLLLRPLIGELLVNTVSLTICTVVLTALAGTLCAWLVERTDLPGRRLLGVLAAVPLAIPPFISSYAWISISASLQDFRGALLVVSAAYMPLVFLPVAASLRGMDPAIEESGRSLGLGPVACFLRVVLPQLRPALLGGMLLVALNVLVEFGAFALLRFRTFTTELYAQYRVGLSGPDPALVATVLVVLCLSCLALEGLVRGRRTYGSLTRSARRPASRYRLGWLRWPALGVFALLVTVTVGVPLATIGFWLTRHNGAATSAAGVSAGLLWQAAANSLLLGALAAGATLLLSLPLGFVSARYGGPLTGWMERIACLGQGLPAIVVALAMVWLAIRLVPLLYQGVALLIVSYAILFLPLCLVSVRAAFGQAERRLEEAARNLGLGPLAAARRVLLPIASPGLGAGAALVFIAVLTELTTTLLLAPIGTETLATEVWADTTTLAFASAAPYAALMVALSLLSTWLLTARFARLHRLEGR